MSFFFLIWPPGQKLSNFFVAILVQTMTPKGHFEINWPLLWCEVEEHSFPGLSNTAVHCAHYNSSYINRKEYYALTGKGTLVSRVNKKSSVQCRVEKGKLSPAMCFEGVGFHRALLQYWTMGPKSFYSSIERNLFLFRYLRLQLHIIHFLFSTFSL